MREPEVIETAWGPVAGGDGADEFTGAMTMSDATKDKGTIVKDPDLKCMGTISKAMQALEADGTPDDLANVVAWFRRKWDRAAPEASVQKGEGDHAERD